MQTVLADIVANKYEELAQRKAAVSLDTLMGQVTPATPGRFEASLKRQSPAFILEIKPASPSAGTLTTHLDTESVVEVYNRFASAISVLTDEKFFQGSLALLSQVASRTPHPVLCKDFIVDPYQVYEARQAGAAAVLLIVKILEPDTLRTLFDTITQLGMTPVVEIQNETELAQALDLNPTVLLINNRNLETFDIAFETTKKLSRLIPDGILRISASGVKGAADVQMLAPDCDAFLIGSALMRVSPSERTALLEAMAR
jgi:indole-3-glycerol phosphate synthase